MSSRTGSRARTGAPATPPDERAQVTRWLVEAVRYQALHGEAPPTDEPPRGLCEAAERHGVEGQLLRYAGSHGVEVPGLGAGVHSALARHQRALVELQEAQRSLAEVGVDVLVVKGPALACGAYPSPELRSYVDLDLLVSPTALRAAVHALESDGFTLLDANWPLIHRRGLRELRLSGPLGGAVDLHWSLSSPAGSTPPPFPQLLAAARSVSTDEVELRTLSWADSLVHVATHAADSGGHRLVWLTDLWALLGALDRDLVGRLVSTAHAWGALPALHVMLARAERVLDTQLPHGLADAARPAGQWPRVVALTDALSPLERAHGEGSLGRLVARSSRDTSARSCAAVMAKTSLWLLHGGAAPPSANGMHDRTNPQSALYPAGGPEARETFFAMVERAVDHRYPRRPRISR